MDEIRDRIDRINQWIKILLLSIPFHESHVLFLSKDPNQKKSHVESHAGLFAPMAVFRFSFFFCNRGIAPHWTDVSCFEPKRRIFPVLHRNKPGLTILPALEQRSEFIPSPLVSLRQGMGYDSCFFFCWMLDARRCTRPSVKHKKKRNNKSLFLLTKGRHRWTFRWRERNVTNERDATCDGASCVRFVPIESIRGTFLVRCHSSRKALHSNVFYFLEFHSCIGFEWEHLGVRNREESEDRNTRS